MSGFTLAWLAWGAAFLLIEGVALWRKAPGDTLTEHVRAIFATSKRPSGPWQKARRVALLALLAWLVVHFLTDGFV